MSITKIKSEHISIQNHQLVCRLCLGDDVLEDIFKQKDLNLLISDFLSIVVSKNDKISRSICAICRARLYEFRDFQVRCLEVQNILKGKPPPVENENLSLDEAEDAKLLSEADPELTLGAYGELQPTVPIVEDDTTEDDIKQPKSPPRYKRIVVTKSGRTKYRYEDSETYENQKSACSICGEKVHESRMEGHQNNHTGLQPYKCQRGCKNISFHSRHVQLYHYRNFHSEQQFQCDICNKLCRSKKMVYDHKRNVHAAKTKVCPVCSKAFSTPATLKEHMKSHDPNREKNFACPVCNHAFYKNWRMMIHLKTHEKDKSRQGKKSAKKQDLMEALKVKIEPGTDSLEMQDELENDSYIPELKVFSLFEAVDVKIESESNHEQVQDELQEYSEEGLPLFEIKREIDPVQTSDIKKELQPIDEIAEEVIKLRKPSINY